MDAFSDPSVHTVVVMSSAQVGKTEIVNNVVGYHVDQDPAPILLIQPTLDMAEAWSKDRLAPMVRDTPALRGRIADPRSRDSGNTLLHKKFAGGHITIAGANSPSSLASRPIRIFLGDEVDRYPVSAGTEGDPVSLGRKRTATFWNRKVGLFSTPTIKGASRIEMAWEESDQRRYYVPCPHCGEHQTLKFRGGIHWDEGKPETAYYVCEHCGAVITEADKPRMLRRGKWVMEKPDVRGIAGFHINELYSPWRRWSEVVADFLSAKRSPETLKTWVNTSLGETWEDAAEKADPDTLMARRENYGPDSLPGDVLLLTAGVDVQGDRLELEIVGWRSGHEDEPPESWGVEYRVLYGDPAQPEVWRQLDELLKSTYAVEDGRRLRIRAACVDSGGHHTAQVYAFCQPRIGRRIFAIKGAAGNKPIWPKKAGLSRKHGGQVWSIGVDAAKDAIYARLRIATPGPGYLHIPADYDEAWAKMLTAEKVRTRYSRGHPVREWIKPEGARNEALDCRVYAMAALHSLGRINWAALALQAGREVVLPEHPQEKPAETVPAPARKAFVKRPSNSFFRR